MQNLWQNPIRKHDNYLELFKNNSVAYRKGITERERPIRSHTCNMQNPCQTFQKPVWITSKSMRTILLNTTRLNQKFDKLVTETYQKPHPQGAECLPGSQIDQHQKGHRGTAEIHRMTAIWIRNHFWSQVSLVMYIYICIYLLTNWLLIYHRSNGMHPIWQHRLSKSSKQINFRWSEQHRYDIITN